MKTLVICLLLANAFLFTWHYSQKVESATRAVVARKALPQDVPRLVLVSELEELPPLKEPAAAGPGAGEVQSEVKVDVAAADLCIDVGPFESAAERDALSEWMHDFVASSHTRGEAVRTRQFFWVYLEPTPSAETAQQNLAELADRGIEDYMLISRGDLKNAISLGLFRSQDSVNRRLAELSEKGYKPVVVPRFETSERFFISMQLAASQAVMPDIPTSLLGPATVTTIACDLMQTSAPPPAPVETPTEPLVEGLTD